MRVAATLPTLLALAIAAIAGLAGLAPPVARAGEAATAEPVQFQHLAWELACDNTRTCRAAGYQADGSSMPVSVLLTRLAGPGTPVTAELTLGDDWENSIFNRLPERFDVVMRIDGRALGKLEMERKEMITPLTPAQTTQLLQALRRDTRIEFAAGDDVWQLSDQGATAVLLKMDEAQGRIDTPGALIRRGTRSESHVLPALPAPVVRAVPLSTRPVDEAALARHDAALRDALRATLGDEDCSGMKYVDETPQLEIERLSDTQLLVSAQCWMGAYNAGSGYWIVDEEPPFKARLVTVMANEYADGQLHATHKGRGIGDCWSSESWVWNGTDFVAVAASSTGMCMGFPGGAWTLPTRVSEVVSATTP